MSFEKYINKILLDSNFYILLLDCTSDTTKRKFYHYEKKLHFCLATIMV